MLQNVLLQFYKAENPVKDGGFALTLHYKRKKKRTKQTKQNNIIACVNVNKITLIFMYPDTWDYV